MYAYLIINAQNENSKEIYLTFKYVAQPNQIS